MECGEFVSQALDHRIDTRRKHTVVPSLKLRDLRPQLPGTNLDWSSKHSSDPFV